MLRSLIFVTVMSLGILGGIANPFYGLLAYLWFAFFRPQEWVWIDITALRLSLVLGVLLLTRSLFAGTFPVFGHRIAIGMVLFWLTGAVAQLSAVNQDAGFYWLDYLARLIIVALLIPRLADTPKKLLLVLAIIAGSIGFHAGKAGLAFLLGAGVQFTAGLAGPWIDNNGYALAAVMIMPLLWAVAESAALFESHSKWIARTYGVAVPFCALTVVGTFSRAGLLALGVSGISQFLLRRRKGLMAVLVVVFATVVLPFVPLPKGYLDRVETIQTYDEVNDQSALGRLHFWSVARDMAADHPLGVGLGNYPVRYNEYDYSGGRYGPSRAVHSSHFQVLAETGYLGALLWGWLMAESMRTCWKIRRRAHQAEGISRFLSATALGVITSIVGFIVGGAFIALALNDLIWILFAITIALERIASAAVATVPSTLATTAAHGVRLSHVAAAAAAPARATSQRSW